VPTRVAAAGRDEQRSLRHSNDNHGIIIVGIAIIILILALIIVAPPSKISRDFSGTPDAHGVMSGRCTITARPGPPIFHDGSSRRLVMP
jgi:hypothetical protein